MSAQEYYSGQKGAPNAYQQMHGSNNTSVDYSNNNAAYGQPPPQAQYAPPPTQYMPQQQQQQQYAPPPTMNTSAPYAEPQYQAPNGEDLSGKANPARAEGRFKPKKKLNDPIFLILFIAVFAGFIVVSALAIRQFIKYNGGGGGFGDNGQGGTGISTSLD
jgi:hypothetical protein